MLLQSPVYSPKKNCPSVTMRSWNSSIAELAVALVVDHYHGKMAKRQFNPHCLRTGKFCHFLSLFSQ